MDKNLAGALLKAQGEMENVTKDKTNPHYNSTYASLAAVLDAVRKPLTNAGLVLYQAASAVDGEVIVSSKLIHAESGEMIEELLPIPVAQKTAQAIGIAITYGRRYLAMAQCGLAPEDTDGETPPPPVAKPQTKPAPVQHRAPRAPAPTTAEPKSVPNRPSDSDFGMGANSPADYPEDEVDFGMGGSEWDNLPNREASDNAYADRAAAIMHSDAEISDLAVKLIKKCSELDRTSGDKTLSIVKKDGTGSGQYGLLVGKIDNLTTKGAHRFVLSALCGRSISQADPPGWKVKELIDWLNDEKGKAATELAIRNVWAAVQQVEKVTA